MSSFSFGTSNAMSSGVKTGYTAEFCIVNVSSGGSILL